MSGRDPATRDDVVDAYAYALRSRDARVNAVDPERFRSESHGTFGPPWTAEERCRRQREQAEALEDRRRRLDRDRGTEESRRTLGPLSAERGYGGGGVNVRPEIGPAPRIRWLSHVACPESPVLPNADHSGFVCSVCGFSWTRREVGYARDLEAVGLVYRELRMDAIGEAARTEGPHRGPAAEVPECSETLGEGNPSGLPIYRPR